MSKRSHNVRIDDELWAAAKEAVAAEGRTITDVIVAALRRLVAGC
jgi:antitoxin component of RelBE/YafQ-DinJ toxin-antitoxin module